MLPRLRARTVAQLPAAVPRTGSADAADVERTQRQLRAGLTDPRALPVRTDAEVEYLDCMIRRGHVRAGTLAREMISSSWTGSRPRNWRDGA